MIADFFYWSDFSWLPFSPEIHGKNIAFIIDGNNDIVDHVTFNSLQEICFQSQLFSSLFGFVLLIDALRQ